MASITLFSIYLLYKYFADKMYYFVTGYFFLLGVAAVTGKFSWPRSDFLKLSVLKGPDFDFLDFFKTSVKVLSDLINPH